MTTGREVRGGQHAVGRRPVAVALVAVAVAGAGRTLEVLTGVHEAVGAPVVSPLLALVGGVVVYRATDGRAVRLLPGGSVLLRALLVGGLGVLAIQAIAHGLEIATLSVAGADPALVVRGESPSTKSTAPAAVGASLLFGVLVTALGEELLFRGAVLSTVQRRLGFYRANAVQAALFGAWHLAWPLAVALGPFEPPVAMPVYALGFVLVPGVVGAVLGVLVRATGTLWTAVLAHAVHNGVAVFVHVRAGSVPVSVLSAALVAGYALLAGVVWWWWLARSGSTFGP